MIGKLKELLRTASGEWVVSFTTRVDPRELFDEFTDKDVDIDIRKASKRRSKTANDFCWAMCTDIAKAIRSTKEEVYRKALWDTRDQIQAYDTLQIRADAVDFFRKGWSHHGIGWFTEVIDYSTSPGYKTVFAFHGSSTFSTSQMHILLESLKQDMVNMNLPILVSKEEEERMMKAWGKAYYRERKSASSAEESSDLKNTTSSEESQTGNSLTNMV